jgi:hypothetical protein
VPSFKEMLKSLLTSPYIPSFKLASPKDPPVPAFKINDTALFIGSPNNESVIVNKVIYINPCKEIQLTIRVCEKVTWEC